MKIQLNRLVCIAVIAVFLVLNGSVINEVKAVEGGGIGIYPAEPNPAVPLSSSWFIYNLLPGEVKNDAVIVANTGDVTKTMKIYSVDATTTKSGSFVLREESENRSGVGDWVRLAKSEVTLAPGQQEKIEFTIEIPTEAEVGDHIGGIVAQPAVEASEGIINVVTRVGARIYETVPGDIVRRLELNGFGYELVGQGGNRDKIRFGFSLANRGNVHLNPDAAIVIVNDLNGNQVESLDASLGTIFPGGETEVPVVWVNTPLFGKYVARATVTYGDRAGEKIEQEIHFTYVSKRAKVLAGGGSVLVLTAVGILASRRVNQKRKK